MNDPVTLQQFIQRTKGVEYILAIIFMALFPVFWKFINTKKGPR